MLALNFHLAHCSAWGMEQGGCRATGILPHWVCPLPLGLGSPALATEGSFVGRWKECSRESQGIGTECTASVRKRKERGGQWSWSWVRSQPSLECYILGKSHCSLEISNVAFKIYTKVYQPERSPDQNLLFECLLARFFLKQIYLNNILKCRTSCLGAAYWTGSNFYSLRRSNTLED